MANRVIRGNMGVAADMLCWTPRHGFALQDVHEYNHKPMAVCEKRRSLCKDATREHADTCIGLGLTQS